MPKTHSVGTDVCSLAQESFFRWALCPSQQARGRVSPAGRGSSGGHLSKHLRRGDPGTQGKAAGRAVSLSFRGWLGGYGRCCLAYTSPGEPQVGKSGPFHALLSLSPGGPQRLWKTGLSQLSSRGAQGRICVQKDKRPMRCGRKNPGWSHTDPEANLASITASWVDLGLQLSEPPLLHL